MTGNSYTLTNAQKERLREASVGQVASGASLLEAGFPVDELARQLFASNSPFLVIDNLPVETLDGNWSVGPTPISRVLLQWKAAPRN